MRRPLLVVVVVVSLLATSFYVLPIAIWLAGRWAVVVPVVELEDGGAVASLRRSRRLTTRRGLKVTSLVVAGAALVLLFGPLIGAVLMLVTSAPFWLVWDELLQEETGDRLPAEIGLTA